MRILILTIYHDPEPIPKTGDLARALTRRGHRVDVVTAFPHYPSGKLYPGYRLRLWSREVRDGVPILRTWIYPYHGTRPLLRMLNYATWMFSSMLASLLTPRVDVMYVWHPPLTVGVSAWVIGRLKRAPFLYDVQDLWPEGAIDVGMLKPGRLVDVMYRLADWVYRRAALIFVVSDQAAEHLRRRGVPASKLRVAKHWGDDAVLLAPPRRPQLRAALGLDGKFVAMFAGNIGKVQGLDTILDAAERLRDEPRIAIVFVGDGLERRRLEALAGEKALANVTFAGAQPPADMPDWFGAADAMLVHVHPGGVADVAVPTKILAYLASGKPILCAMGGGAAQLVNEAGAGAAIPAGDADAIARTLRAWSAAPAQTLAEYGRRGREYFKTHFTRDVVIDDYERALRDLAGEAAPDAQ